MWIEKIAIIILHILSLLVPLLLSVAFMTLAERKVMASMQRRVGPNVWGFCGVLQPFLDALKLLVKEPVFPANADQPLFVWAPMFTFIVSQIGWAVIPAEEGVVLSDVNLGAMYLLSVSSLGVYGIMIAGWSSNSKYAFLGCCRSVAQMISYELPMGIILMTVCMIAGSLNISEIISCQKNIWFGIPLFPLMIMWFICCLAETNRAPFDLPEAEAELVAGYNVEYSSMGFALFFIAEYTNMLLMSTLCALFFLGGTLAPLDILNTLFPVPGSFWLALKMTFFLFLFVWVRATLPRYRYDQLMRLGWKVFLPLSLGFFLVTAVLVLSFETWPLATH
uniref:NADH-ubiquinone oxidoreductase chain 1 n=1 Tax=Bulbochaete rectangularis var. hiloensis TaxID=55990 RepID=A0A6M4SNY5_9CHLO|nr:NADH dehydrogenase subunit 1 [Bulbochaete rectangularis var. hiloensis]